MKKSVRACSNMKSRIVYSEEMAIQYKPFWNSTDYIPGYKSLKTKWSASFLNNAAFAEGICSPTSRTYTPPHSKCFSISLLLSVSALCIHKNQHCMRWSFPLMCLYSLPSRHTRAPGNRGEREDILKEKPPPRSLHISWFRDFNLGTKLVQNATAGQLCQRKRTSLIDLWLDSWLCWLFGLFMKIFFILNAHLLLRLHLH